MDNLYLEFLKMSDEGLIGDMLIKTNEIDASLHTLTFIFVYGVVQDFKNQIYVL